MSFFVDGEEELLAEFAGGLFVGIGEHFHLGFFEELADVDVFDEVHELFVFGHAFEYLIELERGFFLVFFVLVE